MQQTTNRHLYQYWNGLRGTRLAPRRFEIEPARIASLLAETFIVECGGMHACRFRLAGTRICEYFGRELRGTDFLELWEAPDRQKLQRLLAGAVYDGAAAAVAFDGLGVDDRELRFEMVLLPLVHVGSTVNRLLGGIAPLETPYWLGTTPILRHRIVAIDVVWPDAGPEVSAAAPGSVPAPLERGDAQRPFRILQGGLADNSE